MVDDKRHNKFPVTVGEIRRRVSEPENMTKSSLNAYLGITRTSHEASTLSNEIGFSFSGCKPHYSLFSKLVEAEGACFSDDYYAIATRHFPKAYYGERLQEKLFSQGPLGDHKDACDKKLVEISHAR